MSIIDNIRRIAGASKPETKSANVLPSKLWKAMIWAGGWENYSRWPKDKLITQAYERNAPFYAACNIIAQTVADIPVYVDATKNGRIVQTKEHPILRTMELTESRTEFIERLTLYLCVTGEAYAQVSYSKYKGKRPLGLVVVPSQFMNPVMGDYIRPVKGFRYTENGQVDFSLDEIIYIRKPSLSEYWHGMSAGVPTAELVDLFNAGITWNKNIALAGGVPPIIATSPSMLPEEQNEAKSKWREQRGANNAHELTIVSGDLKIDKINDNPHDAEWEKATLNAMRMILMSFGVSSELLNDAGNKTYCLPYKASVATPNGRKHIGDLKAGDIVYSLDLTTDAMVESKVTWQGKTGHMKTKIAKGRGFRLEATDNHPVLVLDKTIAEDGRHIPMPRYKRMDELEKGDIVFKAFEYPDTEDASFDAPSVEMMEFYGAMLGDGFAKSYGGGRNIVSMSGNKGKVRDYYTDVMTSNYTGKVIEFDREVRIINKSAVDELTNLGLCGNAKTKRIPEWVFRTSEEHKTAFLRGLWDTDGSVDKKGHVQFSVSNLELAKDVQRLCLSLGITCDSVSESTRMTALPNGEIVGNYLATFKATRACDNIRVGSRDPKDQARLESGSNANAHGRRKAATGSNTIKRYMRDLHKAGIEFATIVSITEGEVQDVYDIEVEGTHNFIAENIVVHNSNYREARKALYMEASIPMARKIYGAITKHLSKYYEDSPVIQLDVDKIESIQEDRGFAAERLTRMVDAGIITPNEAREELGYSRKDGGDELRRYLSTPRQEQPQAGDANGQP